MSDHFVGLNKGQAGSALSDFTIGTSSGATDIELRVADGAGLNRLDVVRALKAISTKLEMGGLSNILTGARI